MAKVYTSPRALIIGKPKVTALSGEDEDRTKEKDPSESKRRGLKTEICGRSARSRHSCSQLLAAISAPFEVGHISLTYGKDFPKSKEEIQLEKNAICTAGTRCGLFGIWTLEFQRRGAPHFHCLLWEASPGAGARFAQWWRDHTENQDPHAAVIRQGDEAKASWYFNFHQTKGDQTPPVKVGRWWGKINSKVLEMWIQCEEAGETTEDSEVIWLKRLARRFHHADYRGKLRRFLSLPKADRARLPDPRSVVENKYGKDGTALPRRRVHRSRRARSSMGAQGFTWFLKSEHHARVLQLVADMHRKNPF